MRLDAWLKQPHAFTERMRLIERLAQELNTIHDRGESLASIAPESVEVGSDQKIDLRPSARGRPEPGYAAPERLEGGPPSAAADIYSVGALCWEVLVGRPCGESPRPLLDVSPDLPRELANSVMGCLERSPEWRPKDLTYLAQLAAAQQKVVRAPEPAAKPGRAAAPPRSSPAPARSGGGGGGGAPRPSTRRASRSHLPLVIAALLLVAAAASSYLWINREQAQPAATARAAVPAATPTPTAQPDVVATPTPAATAAPTPGPTVAPTATPAPSATSESTPEPTPPPTPVPTPTPAPVRAPTPEPMPVVSEPAVPATLSAVSPLTVKRPGKVLLDIRGAGLRSDQRVRVLALKETPQGISVVRQKWVDAGLVTVLLDLDAKVTPAIYAVALESPDGSFTNLLQLTITK